MRPGVAVRPDRTQCAAVRADGAEAVYKSGPRAFLTSSGLREIGPRTIVS